MISIIDRKDIISEYEQRGSIRAVARNLGIHRKTVKSYVSEYLAAKSGGDETLTAWLKSEPSYKVPQRGRTVLTEEVQALINTCLRENEAKRQRGDRKLCMKASDIHTAVGHAGFKVSYSSVCKYIQATLGHTEETEECFIRQRYRPGQDCEFDWGEMYLTVDGRRIKLYMRHLLDFKAGRRYATKWAADLVARTLAPMDLTDTIIVCIPASSC